MPVVKKSQNQGDGTAQIETEHTEHDTEAKKSKQSSSGLLDGTNATARKPKKKASMDPEDEPGAKRSKQS
eukprot:4328519-Amphidinium_carterae.1